MFYRLCAGSGDRHGAWKRQTNNVANNTAHFRLWKVDTLSKNHTLGRQYVASFDLVCKTKCSIKRGILNRNIAVPLCKEDL